MTTRTFERLSPAGWTQVEPERLANGDVIRVKDDGVAQSLASGMLNGDAGIYTVVRSQRQVGIAVATATGVTEVAVNFTA